MSHGYGWGPGRSEVLRDVTLEVAEGEFVKINGRTTDVINVGGQKVYPGEIEDVLMQIPNVRDATAYGEPNPITGHVVGVSVSLFEPEELTALKRRIRAFCKERLEPYKIPVKVEIVDNLQVTERYKKQRTGGKAVELFQYSGP